MHVLLLGKNGKKLLTVASLVKETGVGKCRRRLSLGISQPHTL